MKSGIRQRLMIIYLIVILPLTALIGYNYYHSYQNRRDHAISEQYHMSRLAGSSFERFVADVVETNRGTGTVIYSNRMNIPQANAFLASAKQGYPMVNMFYANESGIVTASSTPGLINANLTTMPQYARLASGGAEWTITNFQQNANGEFGFTILTAVRSGGSLVAVSGCQVNSRDIQQIIPKDLLNGTVILTDAQGNVVFNSAIPNMGVSERNWSTYEPVRTALKGASFKSGSTALPETDGDYTGSFVPMTSTGWTAGYFTPSVQAFAHVKNEAMVSLFIILIVIAISAAIGLFYIKRISRPIIDLSARSVEIGKGDFSRTVEVKTGDEVELLARNFNRMQGDLKKNFEDLSRLIEASRSVNSALDVRSVSESAAAYLKDILGAGNIIVRIKDQDTGKFSVIFSNGLDEHEAERIARASDAFMGSAAEDTQAVSFYNLVDIGFTPGVFKESGVKALVSLPLVSNNRLIGRIDALMTETTGSKLGRSEMGLAVSFSQQVSVAIQNAKLLERESYIADVLQKSLLTAPQHIPGLDIGLAYQPAISGTKVGGDFYDFIIFDEERVAIVVGDVCGKGIEAARYTALAKNAVRSFASEDPSPSSVVERANKLICGESDSFHFITLFYTLIDRKTGKVRYASGGHPPALFFDHRGDCVNELLSPGMPLGIDPGVSYEEREFLLDDGDKLLLYTDGLTEARRDDEMLGQRGVIQAFLDLKKHRATDLAPKLVEAARSFVGGSFNDDIAVIAIERKAA
ncbi:MAG: SpoIIE family protein phosphatase [Actinobacteria bacterium]|nr:SpoIIE family protein phosphatase [Actinomycetota bacterium]